MFHHNYALSISMEGIYHRRELRAPAIAFSSDEGRNLFRDSLGEGNMEAYFLLAEHYQTQSHPAFCGIASLGIWYMNSRYC